MLDTLLQNNPPYDEQLAERVLSEYCRIHHHRIQRIALCGVPVDDIQQELRIALWQAWLRYDARSAKVGLRQWLSYKLDFCLKGIPRRLARKYERSGIYFSELSSDLS